MDENDISREINARTDELEANNQTKAKQLLLRYQSIFDKDGYNEDYNGEYRFPPPRSFNSFTNFSSRTNSNVHFWDIYFLINLELSKQTKFVISFLQLV